MEKIDVELFVLVDAAGDYAIGKDEAAAREDYENNVQPLSDCDGFRMVKVTLSVPLPAIVELSGTVPEQGEPSQLTAK